MFCAEEDFGIAPVEANAHGAPVIGYAKGGLLETMQSGVTAEFFAEQTAESVAEGIQRAMSHPWDTAALRANAKRFSAEAFRRGVIQVISATLSACDDRPPRRRRKSSDSRS
jgi:glycosyltransferase involved in cell wall biosynthesis